MKNVPKYHHVAFIQPKSKKWGLELGNPPVLHIGIAYLASVLVGHGYSVNVYDENVDELPSIFTQKYICITSLTPTANRALEISRDIKTTTPDVKIILGGQHFSFFPKETLSQNSFIDAVVIGEGEVTLLELLEAYNNNRDLSDVAGIAFQAQNEIVLTKKRDPIENIDLLPFPKRNIFNEKKYGFHFKNAAQIVTSRGCNYHCTFCSPKKFWGKWRSRSAPNVVEELKILVNNGYDTTFFVDIDFAVNAERIKDICEGILEAEIKLQWAGMTRGDNVIALKPFLPLAKKAGLTSVMIGAESPRQDILDSFGKNESVEQIVEATQLLKKNGIFVWHQYIIGSMEDGPEDILNAARFNRTAKADIIALVPFTPLPGTEYFNRVKEYGGNTNTDDYYMHQFVMPTKYMSIREAEVSRLKAYLIAYLDLNVLKNLVHPESFRRKFVWMLVKVGFSALFKKILLRIKHISSPNVETG